MPSEFHLQILQNQDNRKHGTFHCIHIVSCKISHCMHLNDLNETVENNTSENVKYRSNNVVYYMAETNYAR